MMQNLPFCSKMNETVLSQAYSILLPLNITMLEKDQHQSISEQASTKYCKTQWYEPEHFIESIS